MTAAELRLVRLVNARTARMSPEVRRQFIRAITILRETLSLEEIARRLASGGAVFSDPELERAFSGFRQSIYSASADAYDLTARDIPKAIVRGEPAIRFGELNPRVLEAVKRNQDTILAGVKQDVRDVVRQAVATGLQEGQSPIATARTVRDVVGLAPIHEQWVRNYREKLEEGGTRSLANQLRNKRDDAAVRKGTLTPERIDRMVAAYEKRLTAWHAEVVARTATHRTYMQAQFDSYASAIESGIVPRGRARATWVTVGDSKVRDEHAALNGETVPFGTPFSNGQIIPTDWNCRCIIRYSLASA